MNDIPLDHAAHDEYLVVAYASGDLEGRDAERGASLVRACAGCERLAMDIRELRSSMAALPAPRRTRDFRLTEADAERLRPKGWKGLVAALAGPRLSFAAPVGTVIAALGIVGLLVTSLPAFLPAGTASAPALSASGGASVQSAESAAGAVAGAGSAANDTGGVAVPAPSAAASVFAQALPAPTIAPETTVTSPPMAAVPAPAAGVTAAPAAGIASAPVTTSQGEPVPSEAARTSLQRSAPPGSAGPSPLLVGSSVLVFVGLVLVVGRLAARRLAR